MVARTVGLDHTNLGFAGQCMLDPFVALTIRDLDADIISMKVAANIVAEDAMRERPFGPGLLGFLDTIREGKPDTPILVVSPIFSPFGENQPGPLRLNAEGRTVSVDGSDELRRNNLTDAQDACGHRGRRHGPTGTRRRESALPERPPALRARRRERPPRPRASQRRREPADR